MHASKQTIGNIQPGRCSASAAAILRKASRTAHSLTYREAPIGLPSSRQWHWTDVLLGTRQSWAHSRIDEARLQSTHRGAIHIHRAATVIDTRHPPTVQAFASPADATHPPSPIACSLSPAGLTTQLKRLKFKAQTPFSTPPPAQHFHRPQPHVTRNTMSTHNTISITVTACVYAIHAHCQCVWSP